ncbi:TonB-dependent receptor plug domain-containing protein [Persicirhabdus sediminis]|uniref:TonB-dependent receptor n=1 Tax=Persicirhabdus sediminis TaxID=454144 RepID=A0A8J7MDA4_9BACT|nr:TonB-dependent receptor [Persicirhabdus sediminis]MBK1791297.1 TonB-dependent receptor [Persicirhabdus sediminis]
MIKVPKKNIVCMLFASLLLARAEDEHVHTADDGHVHSTELDELEHFVITGSKQQELLSDALVRTQVIDRTLIDDSQARTLAEIIEYTPGLRLDNACGNCNQMNLQMLGLPQPYISILNDGMPNFSSLASVYGIEQIPTGMIDQIEIVKGGGSVLYGPGAVAGVINLIPRNPDVTGHQFSSRVESFSGDSFGHGPGYNFFALGDWVSDDSKLKLTGFANYDYLPPIDINKDGFTNISERKLGAMGLRSLWAPTERSQFVFDYMFTREERRGGDAGDAFDRPPNMSLICEAADTDRHVFTTKWLADHNEKLSTSMAYSYARTDRDSYYGGIVALGSPDPDSPYYNPDWTPDLGFGTTENHLHFVDVTANYEFSDTSILTVGAQYSYETLTDEHASVDRNLDETYTDFGILAQHRWDVSDAWTLEYGARVDWHSEINDPIFSPRAAVMYKANDNFRIRSSVSTGFRAPQVFDEDLHIATVGGDLEVIYQDENLKEESATTISIAPEWKIDDNWKLEMNAFYTWLDDTFVLEPLSETDDRVEFLRTNGESSTIGGVEFNLGYYADIWRVEFSWIQQKLQYENPQLVLGDDTLVDPLDNPIYSSNYLKTPESLGQIKFNYSHDWFDVFVALKATGPMDVPHIISDPNTGDLVRNELKRTDWFFDVDLGLSKEFIIANQYPLTVNTGVKNVFNQFQSDLDSGQYRDPGYTYGPAFPRRFYLGGTIEF